MLTVIHAASELGTSQYPQSPDFKLTARYGLSKMLCPVISLFYILELRSWLSILAYPTKIFLC
jgi:hypothetical protein